MNTQKTLAAIIGAAVLFLGPCVGAQDQCPPITDAERARLIDYVRAKYKVPAANPLALGQVSQVAETCYRKLRFEGGAPNPFFHVDLVASPDLRFLARDLLDSHLNPAEEEQRKAQALIEMLSRGTFASLGEKTAPITITEFADFQCPYCAQASDSLLKDILPTEQGKVRLVFRHFPLPAHAWARGASLAAACAQQQGNSYFWDFHGYLFDHQREITPDNLRSKLAAFAAGLARFDEGAFGECLNQQRAAPIVDGDVGLGNDVGVRGTPTFFINGRVLSGMQPEQIRTFIREMTEQARE